MNDLLKSYEGPNYDIKFQFVLVEEERLLFLHLDVHKWGKEVLLSMRKDLEEILLEASEAGLESVSFSLQKPANTKFHNMLKPLSYEAETDTVLIGGWFTME